MRILALSTVLLAATLVCGLAEGAEAVAAGDAASIGARLDLSSFANSTGPRREPGKRTPADYGFALPSVADGWASFIAPARGWRLGVKVLKKEPGRTLVCFVDEAQNGGSYFHQTALVLAPAPGHFYRATPAPGTRACPTLTSRRP